MNDEYPTEVTDGLKLRFKQDDKCQANPNNSGFTCTLFAFFLILPFLVLIHCLVFDSSDSFVVPFMLMHFGQAGGQGSSEEERILILQMVRTSKISVDEGVKLITACENTSHSAQSYTIVGMKTEYQFEGETQWRKTEFNPELVSHESLPLEIKPRSAIKISLKATVKAEGKNGSWFNQAFVTRLKPIKFKLTMEEMGGGKATTYFEYANPPSSFPTKQEKDLFFLGLDSFSNWERFVIRVVAPESSEYLFKIALPNSSVDVTPKMLRVWYHSHFLPLPFFSFLLLLSILTPLSLLPFLGPILPRRRKRRNTRWVI